MWLAFTFLIQSHNENFENPLKYFSQSKIPFLFFWCWMTTSLIHAVEAKTSPWLAPRPSLPEHNPIHIFSSLGLNLKIFIFLCPPASAVYCCCCWCTTVQLYCCPHRDCLLWVLLSKVGGIGCVVGVYVLQ